MQIPKPKYGNKHCKYAGRVYDSRFESSYAMFLNSFLKAGRLKEVTPQYKIALKVNGEQITNHYVDFRVVLADGRVKMVECKGFPTEVYRLKLKLLRALYPEMTYLINPGQRELLA